MLTTDQTDFTDGKKEMDREHVDGTGELIAPRPEGLLLHRELSGVIIGAAMDVLNVLKPGFDEKLYERALVLELCERGRSVDQQKRFVVRYKTQEIGTLIPNLIVDTKVVSVFNESHVAGGS
jgi:hypothetical protein